MFSVQHLAVVSLLVSQVYALVPPRGNFFDRRQSNSTLNPADFPVQCQAICTPIISVLNTCAGLTCLCTSANGNSLESCMDCTASISPSPAIVAQAQSVLDQFTSECNQGGIPVSSLTVSITSSPTSTGVTAKSTVQPSPIPSSGFVTFSSSFGSGPSPTNPPANTPAPKPSSPSSSSSSNGGGANPFLRNSAKSIQISTFGILSSVALGALAVLV